jgi:hypothetical protein
LSKFFVQVFFQAAISKQIFEETSEAAEHAGFYPSDSSIQFMAEVIRYQLRFSSASCTRPDRVSV